VATASGWNRWWRVLRDPLTWTLGAGLLIYETVARHGQDSELLVVASGLIGLPIVVRYEERRQTGDDEGKSRS
jgi:hypothetical protein